MPGGDRTGPTGMGPMTGRGAGYCAGYLVPGYAGGVGGRGLGGMGRGFGGRGGGRGYRNRFFATGLNGRQRAVTGQEAFGGVMPAAMSPDQQLDALKGQAEYFEDALEDIRKRIEELGGKARESDK